MIHALLLLVVLALPNTKATLSLGTEWKEAKVAGVVVAYKGGHGEMLVVTRADVPNPDAWVEKSKQAYADLVEKGIKAKVAGYKRVAKKVVDAHGVPALDVEAKRDGGATVVVRVLLFRTYALSLAIEVPKGVRVAPARAIAKAFAPPPEKQHADD